MCLFILFHNLLEGCFCWRVRAYFKRKTQVISEVMVESTKLNYSYNKLHCQHENYFRNLRGKWIAVWAERRRQEGAGTSVRIKTGYLGDKGSFPASIYSAGAAISW